MHLPLLVGHAQVNGEPADEARVQLAELLQVKSAAQARVELAAHEEVVNRVACVQMTRYSARFLWCQLQAPPKQVSDAATADCNMRTHTG